MSHVPTYEVSKERKQQVREKSKSIKKRVLNREGIEKKA